MEAEEERKGMGRNGQGRIQKRQGMKRRAREY